MLLAKTTSVTTYRLARAGKALNHPVQVSRKGQTRGFSCIRTMAAKGRTAVEETESGAFKRTDSEFRNWIRPDSEFAPEGAPSL